MVNKDASRRAFVYETNCVQENLVLISVQRCMVLLLSGSAPATCASEFIERRAPTIFSIMQHHLRRL